MRRRRLEVTSPKSVLVPGHLSAHDAFAGASPGHACRSSCPETLPRPPPPLRAARPHPGAVLLAVLSREPGRTEPGRAGPPGRARSPWRPSLRRRPWTVSSRPGSSVPGARGLPPRLGTLPGGGGGPSSAVPQVIVAESLVTPAPQPHLGGSSVLPVALTPPSFPSLSLSSPPRRDPEHF